MLTEWQELVVGKRLRGSRGVIYRIDEVHAIGGHSVIFKSSCDDDVNKLFAIKMRKPNSLVPPTSFQREIELLTRSERHRHLIIGHDCAQDESGSLAAVLEWAPMTLEQKIQHHPLTWGDYLPVMADVLEALVFLHESWKVVHRDVCPRNIVFSESDPKSPSLPIWASPTNLATNPSRPTIRYSALQALRHRGHVIVSPMLLSTYSRWASPAFWLLSGKRPFEREDRECRRPRNLSMLYKTVHHAELSTAATECVAELLVARADSARPLLAKLRGLQGRPVEAPRMSPRDNASGCVEVEAHAYAPPIANSTDELVDQYAAIAMPPRSRRSSRIKDTILPVAIATLAAGVLIVVVWAINDIWSRGRDQGRSRSTRSRCSVKVTGRNQRQTRSELRERST